jgi:hypothetical protein
MAAKTINKTNINRFHRWCSRVAKLSEDQFSKEIKQYLKDPTISNSLSVFILSDKLTSMLSITANQIPKVSERLDDLRPDKSFQSFPAFK